MNRPKLDVDSNMKIAKDHIDQASSLMEDAIKEAYLQGVEHGVGLNVKPPSQAQFNKDHAQPVWYGEDYAGVVAVTSKKKAAEMLECDVDMVEEVIVGWKPYYMDGELVVDYYMGREVEPRYHAWGIYL